MLIQKLKRNFTKVLMIHPIFKTHSKKTVSENDLYNADEGLRLVDSLFWYNCKGPFFNFKFNQIFTQSKQNEGDIKVFNRDESYNIGETVKIFGTVARYDGDDYYTFEGRGGDQEIKVPNYSNRFKSFNNVTFVNKKSKVFFLPKMLICNIEEFIEGNEVGVVFVNDYLTMGQIKNIRKVMKLNYEKRKNVNLSLEDNNFVVIDRLGLILQIFNKRTTNKIARLQVALIYLHYMKSVFIKGGESFVTLHQLLNFDITIPLELQAKAVSAKQSGGNFLKGGEGEREKELNKRRFHNLDLEIKKSITQSNESQKKRLEKQVKNKSKANVALIGYTNSGKSAVLNAFAKKEVMESKDMLFQTLNTKNSRVHIKGNFEVIMIDTIGFISNLPHELIEPFVTTMEHIKHADIIIHVRDISHPLTDNQNSVVMDIFNQLGFSEKIKEGNFIEVKNKVDLLMENEDKKIEEYENNENEVYISATKNLNLDKMKKIVQDKIYKIFDSVEYCFKYDISLHDERFEFLQDRNMITDVYDMEYSDVISEEFPNGFIEYKSIINQKALDAYKKRYPSKQLEKKIGRTTIKRRGRKKK